MRTPTISFIALFTTLCAGCIEPELGDAPFFCNTGNPKCPDGYECVAGQCVLEGLSPTADGGPAAQADRGSATGDGPLPKPDAAPTPVKWDLGATTPDASPSSPDTGSPPTSSCGSDNDCTDPLTPCCCLGVCEIVCLFTLCF